MIRILFICHGNICRSTMAEFVMRYLLDGCDLKDKVTVDSKATSSEEIGNPPHRGTVDKLRSLGIPVYSHRASRLRKSDYDFYDYIIGMDSANIRNIQAITGLDRDKKVYKLMDFTDRPRDIADPWYTGDFDTTYTEIRCGCEELLNYLKHDPRVI